ncbi:polyprenyl synthetase family protein [Arthrobacter halodurans]|uniref:Polyprenyl synthetase family protein n=1 Tax=Arthrobacter halodurans TaxID=516699 RepID=A0ABV4UIN2_9MICC
MNDSPTASPTPSAPPVHAVPSAPPAPRADVDAYTARVNADIARFLRAQEDVVGAISGRATELVLSIQGLVRGGKRLRPQFAYWGFVGAGGDPDADVIVRAGAALELFQAAALIHDDVIDRSDTRRGQPSVHRRFEAIHAARGWHRDGRHFGEAAAILAGDLCLSYSEQLFGSIQPVPPAARAVFDAMRTQVMAGQFLDVLEEAAGPSDGPSGAVERARTVLRYKSAKYSTENPMLLGGALAGAAPDLLGAYSRFALPLGEAFQLRDDVLGVFGDPVETGKPSGDDLREGKRTELVAHALRLAAPDDRGFIERRLGADDLTDAEVERMCEAMRGCGALEETEASIRDLSDRAFSALAELPVDGDVRRAVRALGVAAVTRRA